MNLKALLLLVALLGFAHADVMPPDYHGVDHRIYIDNLADYSEYQFFVYPTFVGGGVAVFNSSEVPHPYKFAQARLYAVLKTDMPANYSADTFTPPTSAISGNMPGFSDQLLDSDPTTTIETHYAISVSGGEIVLTKTSETRSAPERRSEPERPLDYWLLLPGIALGLAGGYLIGKKR